MAQYRLHPLGVEPPQPVVPEPEIYAMLLGGLCLVGFVAGRKKMDFKMCD
ncbi:MAG: PEP-CTERM sorting domain-containing protein [Nitrosospira sp.]|nr:PEP-CTERM sorting domain-containing protein [Nitrosospira sp.]